MWTPVRPGRCRRYIAAAALCAGDSCPSLFRSLPDIAGQKSSFPPGGSLPQPGAAGWYSLFFLHPADDPAIGLVVDRGTCPPPETPLVTCFPAHRRYPAGREPVAAGLPENPMTVRHTPGMSAVSDTDPPIVRTNTGTLIGRFPASPVMKTASAPGSPIQPP